LKRLAIGAGGADSMQAAAATSSRKLRTQAVLLESAMRLVGSGSLPSVADVAALAGVSRATAYRYFPSRSKLISAVVDESLGPVRQFDSGSEDGLERVRQLFETTFPRFREFEPQLRAALQLALEHQAMQRAGLLDEEPFRRGHRRRILAQAAAPLKATLGARGFDRLLKSLSLVYGIESYVVLKDIWDCDEREISRVASWMVEALVDAALRQAPPSREPLSLRGPRSASRARSTPGIARRNPAR
jgi:AcrR family transcriptional regulator